MKDNIDINADLGESFGRFILGNDEGLMPYLTSCNIACGFHGGDPLTIRKTVELAARNGVNIGAHPSYPDLQGFGRRSMKLPMDELKSIIHYQVAVIKTFAQMFGKKLIHVKPHGALNNDMMRDSILLSSVLDAVLEVDPKLLILIPFRPDIRQSNIRYEIYADRTYENDYQLTPRSIQGSVLNDEKEIKSHLENIIGNKKIRCRQGSLLDIKVDSICVHGDNDNAIKIGGLIHSVANRHNKSIASLS